MKGKKHKPVPAFRGTLYKVKEGKETSKKTDYDSGFRSYLQGRDLGVLTEIEDIDGKEVVTVRLTNGRNNLWEDRVIGCFTENSLSKKDIVSLEVTNKFITNEEG